MRLSLFLDYLEPPGALAFLYDVKPDGKEEPATEEKCLALFFSFALKLTMTNLATQIIEARQMCHGLKPPSYYIKKWQKRAQPAADVRFGKGLYLLTYPPGAADKHPLVAQAWKYLKTALDVVSDDARDGLIFPDLVGYESELPLKLLTAHQKLPKLTFA